MDKGRWTFLTNHGRVFVFIAKNPLTTTLTISKEVNLSLRGVQKIIVDLEHDGYIKRLKEGRQNHYLIHPYMPMRHRLEQEHSVGKLLQALGYKSV